MLVNRFWNESVTPQGASVTVIGAARDVGAQAGQNHGLCAFNAMAVSDQAGAVRIESSLTGSTWYRSTVDVAVAAGTPAILSIPVVSRFHRAVYVNGATAQGSFKLDTSYTES